MIAPAPIVTPDFTKAPCPSQTSGPIVVIGQLPAKGRLRARMTDPCPGATRSSQPFTSG